MQKVIQFLSGTIFLIFLSFLAQAEIKFVNVGARNSSRSDSLGPVLYRLYIENPVLGSHKKRKFQKLIDTCNASNRKLVFQFYFVGGKITLITFPGPTNHGVAFDTTLQLQLGICDPCPNDTMIDGKLVSFGDMEIKGEHSTGIAKELKSIAASSDYIIFIPYLVDNAGVTTINYSITGSATKDIPTVCTLTKSNFANAVNINPSPPRKIN